MQKMLLATRLIFSSLSENDWEVPPSPTSVKLSSSTSPDSPAVSANNLEEGPSTRHLILARVLPKQLPLLSPPLPSSPRGGLDSDKLSTLQKSKPFFSSSFSHRCPDSSFVDDAMVISQVSESAQENYLGAAVDLRTGVNFNPETGLLDPKYAPPEQLVVPQEVPRAPPRFVALVGSPALWQLTSPDRFDTYSVGVLLLQLSVPQLRSGKQLDNLKSQLRACGEDLKTWREEYGDAYDLSLLDRKGGQAWDLATQLVRPRNQLQRGRLSARQAMGHRYFWPEL